MKIEIFLLQLKKFQHRDLKGTENKPLTLRQLADTFFLVFIGLLIGVAAFLCELFRQR